LQRVLVHRHPRGPRTLHRRKVTSGHYPKNVLTHFSHSDKIRAPRSAHSNCLRGESWNVVPGTLLLTRRNCFWLLRWYGFVGWLRPGLPDGLFSNQKYQFW
jgi:hypothetical protein